MIQRRAPFIFVCLLLTAAGCVNAQTPAEPADWRLEQILERVRQKVRHYQEGLFSISFSETVSQQETEANGKLKGKPKEFIYDSIVTTSSSTPNRPAGDTIITRTLKSVNG